MPRAPKGSAQDNCAQNSKDPRKDPTLMRIQILNGLLRRTGEGGETTITPGIAALGQSVIDHIRHEVALYTGFDTVNDPYCEHDFGKITFGGQQVFWKIDYFDLEMEYHSIDPANPDITTRVLTIMLASEY